MLKGKLDIKTIFILVLAVLLIISFLTRPSKTIDTYEDKIEELDNKNKELLSDNDNLKVENLKLSEEVDGLLVEIDEVQIQLDETNDRVKDLEDGKGKVSDYVKSLDADGVANTLTDYLNRRTE